jgi:hypothetical protein
LARRRRPKNSDSKIESLSVPVHPGSLSQARAVAMAVAMIYPEVEKVHRGKHSKIKSIPVHRGLLSQARAVLRASPDDARAVASVATVMAWFKGQGFENFRIISESGCFVVCGRGRRIPCDSEREAREVIAELQAASSAAAQSARRLRDARPRRARRRPYS